MTPVDVSDQAILYQPAVSTTSGKLTFGQILPSPSPSSIPQIPRPPSHGLTSAENDRPLVSRSD